MAVISTGQTFSDGEQVTAAKLNTAVNSSTFDSGAVDNASTQLSGGAIIVKDTGITTAKIADSNVTTAKIADANVTTAKILDANVTTAKIADSNVTTAKILDANVTKAKIENVANMKVLGNTTGSAAAPSEVSVLDEDDLVSDSATALATQQSIKAYVDSQILSSITWFESTPTLLPALSVEQLFTHSLSATPKEVKLILRCTTAQYGYSIGDEVHLGDYGDNANLNNYWANSTQVGYELGSYRIKNRSSSSYATLTQGDSNWEIFIRAI